MRTIFLFFAALLLVHFASADRSEEHTFFQACVDKERTSCFKKCDQLSPQTQDLPLGFSEYPRDSLQYQYDFWSTKLLGWKTLRRREYTPCQDRCIQHTHITCTEQNWARGGKETFQQYGRMPMVRFGIIEEVASALFSCICAIAFIYFIFIYSKETAPKVVSRHDLPKNPTQSNTSYPFRPFFQMYFFQAIIAFVCATLFHIKDTPLTERLDYYSAFLGIMYTVYVTLIRVSWTDSRRTQILLGLPFIAYSIYHLYYMQFVSFDYGYNMKVLIIAGIADSLMWVAWSFKTRYPHGMRVVINKALLGAFSIFEVFDFAPIGGYVDAHAIWHACMIIAAAFYTHFLILDAKYFQHKKDE